MIEDPEESWWMTEALSPEFIHDPDWIGQMDGVVKSGGM